MNRKTSSIQIPPLEINCSESNGTRILWNVDLLKSDVHKKEPIFFDVDSIFNEEDTIDKKWAMTRTLDEPIIITKNGGKFEVLDGKHRLYRAKMCGQKKIAAYFFDECEVEKYIIN